MAKAAGTLMATIDDLRIEPRDTRPRRNHGWRPVTTVAALLAAAGVGWFIARHQAEPTVNPPPPLSSEPPRQVPAAFTAAGYVEVIPPGPIVVSSPIEGQIESISVVPGQAVRDGDPIGRIQDAPYRQEVAIAEASVAIARARLARAKANLARDQQLFSRGAVSGEVLDASKAEAAAADAELALENAELDRARWRLERCVITAPASGVVLEVFVQPGHWIYPRASGERPGAVLSLTDPRAVQVWVDVNQRDLSHVSVGQTVHLATDTRPQDRILGRVARIVPRANLQKNTVQVKIEIPDPPADLRPETSVKVTFLPEERP